MNSPLGEKRDGGAVGGERGKEREKGQSLRAMEHFAQKKQNKKNQVLREEKERDSMHSCEGRGKEVIFPFLLKRRRSSRRVKSITGGKEKNMSHMGEDHIIYQPQHNLPGLKKIRLRKGGKKKGTCGRHCFREG